MKIQDSLFLLTFLIVLIIHKPHIPAFIGLLCVVLAIPLFSAWIFFTAERLTWYAGAFFLLAIGLHLWEMRKY